MPLGLGSYQTQHPVGPDSTQEKADTGVQPVHRLYPLALGVVFSVRQCGTHSSQLALEMGDRVHILVTVVTRVMDVSDIW